MSCCVQIVTCTTCIVFIASRQTGVAQRSKTFVSSLTFFLFFESEYFFQWLLQKSLIIDVYLKVNTSWKLAHALKFWKISNFALKNFLIDSVENEITNNRMFFYLQLLRLTFVNENVDKVMDCLPFLFFLQKIPYHPLSSVKIETKRETTIMFKIFWDFLLV